jgi:hypothetical protein
VAAVLWGKKTIVYGQNQRQAMNMPLGENVGKFNIKLRGTYPNQSA